jgi:Flp pilus assembly protein TadG
MREYRKAGHGLRQALCKIVQCVNDNSGQYAVITALLSPAVLGALGLGAESSYWYVTQRGMQNAADAGAIAASINGSSSYAAEAKAVAAQMGYQNGVSYVSVTATDSAACPGGGNNCYSVTVNSLVPLYLSQLVGYSGTTTVNGTPYTSIGATAIATKGGGGPACVLALDPSDAKSATMTGGNLTLNECDLQVNSSNADAFNMTGGVITAKAIDIVGSFQATGGVRNPTPSTGQSASSDPYSGLFAENKVTQLEGETCTYTNKTVSGGSVTLTPGAYCGGLSISGGIVTLSAGVYVIEGGLFSVTGGIVSGSGVTIVLTKNSSGQFATAKLTGGDITFSAPTSGEWSGLIIYQDPSEAVGQGTSNVTGSSYTMTGALYFPTQAVDFTGGATNNSQCTQLIGYTLSLTGGVFNNNCAGTGVLPISGARGRLVS